jgi:hypothetical protein
MQAASPPDALSTALSTLGEDLLLLSVRPTDGRIVTLSRIHYGLMGSELIRLAATGRVDIVDDRIVVRSAGPSGDDDLDAALESITQARRPPRPRAWVGHPRRSILNAYLTRLISAGALRSEPGGIFGRPRHRIASPQRVAEARARLDVIAESAGIQVDIAQAAFGGLVHAVELDRVLYPGSAGRPLRKRLKEISAGKWTTPAPGARPSNTASAVSSAVSSAVTQAATSAATAAATQAATQAATDAAIQAAVQAAVQASAAAVAAAAAASTVG